MQMQKQVFGKNNVLVLKTAPKGIVQKPQRETSIEQYFLPVGSTIVDSPFTVMFMRITPEAAKAILGRNRQKNRGVNEAYVKTLAGLISSGNFKITHQGIAFDIYGNLLDGQHRLLAIIESGIPVVMMVSFGVPQETMQIIDSQQVRALCTRLGFIGIKTTAKAITVARILEYGIDGSARKKIGDVEAIRLLRKYSKVLKFVSTLGIKLVPSAIIAAVAMAFYTVKDREILHRFVEVYKTGIPSNDREMAPVILKRKVADIKVAASKHRSSYTTYDVFIYRLTESAISRFAAKEKVKVLFSVEKELYPLPTNL